MALLYCFVMAVSILVHAHFYLFEISSHVDEYRSNMDRFCGPEHKHHGVCLGPSWKMAFEDTLVFSNAEMLLN